MQNNNLPVLDRISALADGVLSGEEFATAMEAVHSNPQAMQSWYGYHLVGDVLRGDAGGVSTDGGLGFWQRLEGRLEMEPVRSVETVHLTETFWGATGGENKPSANEEVFRWKLLAGVACLGLAGVLGWGAWSQTAQPQGGQFSAVQLQSPSQQSLLTASPPPAGMLRDPVLDDLLAQHQRFGGHSVLQVPTGFLRNTTYEVPAK
jgi:sigma-E factor negative regulatory protein RseA